MWDVKLKATNKQIREIYKQIHRHGQQYGGYQKESGVERSSKWEKGSKIW